MYSVKLEYQDRKTGPEGRTLKIDTGSMAAAIGKATREFLKSLDRKQRFDANKGLQIEASRAASGETEAPENAKGATA